MNYKVDDVVMVKSTLLTGVIKEVLSNNKYLFEEDGGETYEVGVLWIEPFPSYSKKL